MPPIALAPYGPMPSWNEKNVSRAGNDRRNNERIDPWRAGSSGLRQDLWFLDGICASFFPEVIQPVREDAASLGGFGK